LIYCRDANSGLRSGKQSEAFWWSRIPNDTRGQSRIFCTTPTSEVQSDHILHHTPKLGIPVESVQFHMKLLLKQRILAVYHDSPNHIHFMLRSRNRKFWKGRSWSGNSGRSELESDILPPAPQPWMPYLNDGLY